MTWAAREAGRARLLTLTLLPTHEDGHLDWQRTRGQFANFTHRLRSDYGFEAGWAVEENPRHTGYHLHALTWGEYVPQRALSDLWGGRRVDIRALRRPSDGLYAMKDAVTVAGYTVKHGTDDYRGLGAHLDINGGRAAHFTRGFLHGLTSDEAMHEIAVQMGADGQALTWHLEPGWDPAPGL